MSDNQDSNIPWWAIVFGFMLFPPIGFLLLFLSLAGVKSPTQQTRRTYIPPRTAGQSQRQTPPPTAGAQGQYRAPGGYTSPRGAAGQPGYTARGTMPPQQGRPQAKTDGAGTARKKPAWSGKLKDGKLMTAVGGIVGFIFSIGLISTIGEEGFYDFASWFPVLGFACAGLFTMFTGLGRTRRARRCRLYLGAIGRQKSIFLSDLAGTAGVSEKKVIDDIQWMLSESILPMGYIDRATNRLVLTEEGFSAASHREETAPERAPEKTEEDDNAILRQIKLVNDAIPDDEMSRKIDRIGEITGKILDYQRRNPAKAAELRQFLNYYLPTTLKILNAYAQMDAQGVEGENISAAKKRIEEMMDKIVEGFEKQLDQLFKTEAMDITTDVEVLERMLDKDGLGSGMTLGC